MKQFMTFFLAIVLIAGITTTSKAQISIGANVGLALPMGDFGKAYKAGFGGSANGEYDLADNMSIGLNIGYYSFSGESDYYTWSYIPVVANFKYLFKTEGVMPYVGAGLGFYSATSKYDNSLFSNSYSKSKFGFAPMVGFWKGEGFKWGVNLNYNIVSDASYIGFNVGIIYSLGK